MYICPKAAADGSGVRSSRHREEVGMAPAVAVVAVALWGLFFWWVGVGGLFGGLD